MAHPDEGFILALGQIQSFQQTWNEVHLDHVDLQLFKHLKDCLYRFYPNLTFLIGQQLTNLRQIELFQSRCPDQVL